MYTVLDLSSIDAHQFGGTMEFNQNDNKPTVGARIWIWILMVALAAFIVWVVVTQLPILIAVFERLDAVL